MVMDNVHVYIVGSSWGGGGWEVGYKGGWKPGRTVGTCRKATEGKRGK